MKTTKMLTRDSADQTWYVVDAEGKVLGRMATKIATRFIGFPILPIV